MDSNIILMTILIAIAVFVIITYVSISVTYILYVKIKESQEKERKIIVSEETKKQRKKYEKICYFGIILLAVFYLIIKIIRIISIFI